MVGTRAAPGRDKDVAIIRKTGGGTATRIGRAARNWRKPMPEIIIVKNEAEAGEIYGRCVAD